MGALADQLVQSIAPLHHPPAIAAAAAAAAAGDDEWSAAATAAAAAAAAGTDPQMQLLQARLWTGLGLG